jgi:hypothetical protein
MLSQKLSRITLKMTDLQEYEDMKKKKESLERQKLEGDIASNRKKKTPRKVLTFDTTPARSSTPDQMT